MGHQWLKGEHEKQKDISGVNKTQEKYSPGLQEFFPYPDLRELGVSDVSSVCLFFYFAPTCHAALLRTRSSATRYASLSNNTMVLKFFEGERDLKCLWTIRCKIAYSPKEQCTFPLFCIQSQCPGLSSRTWAYSHCLHGSFYPGLP